MPENNEALVFLDLDTLGEKNVVNFIISINSWTVFRVKV